MTITMQKTPATLQRDEGQIVPIYPHNTKDLASADQRAFTRIIATLMEDPRHYEKLARRWIVDQLLHELPSTWLDHAARCEARGDFTEAAQVRIHAHLLAGGDALDPIIAADVEVLMGTPAEPVRFNTHEHRAELEEYLAIELGAIA